MRSETRRSLRKSVSSRSVSSDPGSAPDLPYNLGPKSPNRLQFWRRRRTVIPASLPLSKQPSRNAATSALTSTSPLSNDPNENIIFLNNPTEFDLRSLFFRRSKPNPLPGCMDKSGISYESSASSHRSHNNGLSPKDESKATPMGAKTEVVDPTNENFVRPTKIKPKRRLRAKEELCVVRPKSTSRGRTRSQKSWFLGPGFIGRDNTEGTIVATKDSTMDAVHAEVSVVGDDYLVRDAGSTMGTFLCLSTRYRHYPQRDGFRLRRGDVFRIGPTTSIRVQELRTTTDTPVVWSSHGDKHSSIKAEHSKPKVEAKTQPRVLERTYSISSSGSGNSPRMLKRLSTVEELRLIAADIEDEFKDIVGDNPSGGREAGIQNENINNSGEEKKLAESNPGIPRRSVRFADAPPVMSDGSEFLGSRYVRQEIKELKFYELSEMEDEDDDVIKQLVGAEFADGESQQKTTQHTNPSKTQHSLPDFIRLVVFQHDPSKASSQPPKHLEAREVILPGQKTYLIGSSSACDLRIFPSEGIEVRPVHARITFDGTSFVLQDLSFEHDQRRQTRVLLNQRAVRVVRGDWLLLGKCALLVTTVTRAFGTERRPDMKEAAMRLDVLRLSKRKPRTRGIFLPIGFKLHSTSGSGASSGSSGWGGSSGGPVTFGKGRGCDAQVFTVSLAVEQFIVQLERGTCLLTPKPTGINVGTYFLIGRDDPGQPRMEDESGDKTKAVHTEDSNEIDIVKQTSKPLLLSETCVFRCGGCELEVIYTKTRASSKDRNSSAVIEEQEHIQLLSTMSWLQQIVYDRKLISNLARCGQRLQLNTGDVIYEKNDSADFFFIVISGEVGLLYLSSSDDYDQDTDGMQTLTERVITGGFFGEASLQEPLGAFASSDGDLEYTENATAATACELLALAKEDICGYLEIYMDVVRAHLRHDRNRDRLIRAACRNVPWLRGISLQEMRLVAKNAELAHYGQGSVLFEDGKLFVPAAFTNGSTPQLREGLLVLSRGKVRVIRSKNESHRRSTTSHKNEGTEEELQLADGVDVVDEMGVKDVDEWWDANDPVIIMGSSSFPSMFSICDLSFRLEAYSAVECFFIAAAHIAHLFTGAPQDKFVPVEKDQPPLVKQLPPPMTRGNSLVARRMHHSQVVTSSLHSRGAGGSGDGNDDDDHQPLDGYDGEGDSIAARRWRRKKRNKQLLEETVLETQNDAQIQNALVLYVLAGAQRGDIHVVRNVATIGGLLSGADIEINDRYVSRSHAIIEYHDNKYWLYDNGSKWGTFVRLEEDNAVDINPGDIFLAGEVEFTCLASYPDRTKSSICCIM